MDVAWIQVFVLTMAECVAPAGKAVCQEQQFQLSFVSRADCEYALQQLVALKEDNEQVIVNREKSLCVAAAMESETFASREAINEAHKDQEGWRAIENVDARRSSVNDGHRKRLENLPSCEESAGDVPCKIGEIIVEEDAGDRLDVWKRD